MVDPFCTDQFYTIRPIDVGKTAIHCFGRGWLVSGFIGKTMHCDVGKRVYLRSGILQVENDEQYRARTRNKSNPDE